MPVPREQSLGPPDAMRIQHQEHRNSFEDSLFHRDVYSCDNSLLQALVWTYHRPRIR